MRNTKGFEQNNGFLGMGAITIQPCAMRATTIPCT